MLGYWNETKERAKQGTLGKEETDVWNRLNKALRSLVEDPHYPGLQSHEIFALTKRYGRKVFESYLENNTPGAGRIFWVYGPAEGEITVIGMMPHPEAGAYGRVPLSDMPAETAGTRGAKRKPAEKRKYKKGAGKKKVVLFGTIDVSYALVSLSLHPR